MNDNKLLSICIPTYNRAKVLEGNLRALESQIVGRNLPVEIIVSDNASSDDTSAKVEESIKRGLPIKYLRNQSNLGMDGNFAQCYRRASAKYVLVLGDDDYLLPGKLEKLLSLLATDDYGLVHLRTTSKVSDSAQAFKNSSLFLKEVSYWITYITSNVVNTRYIEGCTFEEHFGTYLAIMPLYIEAATLHQTNLIVNERIFADGVVSETNGGYNYFQVFVVNYLKIWRDAQRSGQVGKKLVSWIRRDVFRKCLAPKIYKLLIEKRDNNYQLDNSWKSLFSEYGFAFFAYFDFSVFLVGNFINFLARKVSRAVRKLLLLVHKPSSSRVDK